jgi:2-polyprenyl-3-methyl-5-hydroxy-6-metoxy-1,4-benzoquinol methylase
MKTTAEVAADFDEIAAALAASPPRDRLTPAERALLAYVPASARTAIDVGCGDGVITRAVADRGIRVLGVDVSPRMIALARVRTPATLPIEYREVDVMHSVGETAEFDVVISVSMVHHLPLDAVVPRLTRLVTRGGTLLIQDVIDRSGILNCPRNMVGAVARRTREFVLGSAGPRAVTQSYAKHGKGEKYLTPADVAKAYEPFVPGARIVHHLEWRYSVVWMRPT